MEKEISTVVICIDRRFQHQAVEMLEQKYGALDVIALAGASKNLSSPNHKGDKHAILESIDTSIKLHHPSVLILTNHIDCGAYGGSDKFYSKENEVNFHRQELQKAKKVVNKIFPNIPIKSIFLDKDRDNNVILLIID